MSSILFGLILMELGLRITGMYHVYSEKLGDQFFTYYNYTHKLHYKILPPNQAVNYNQKEFSITFKSNYLGMRNANMEVTPPDSVYRIICLGDSYTEGDGANIGREYPRQLEQILREKLNNPNFEVINAGKNGSDILYAEKILTQELYRLSPKMVVLCINKTDIEDIIQRGGPERFKNDGTTAYKNGPKYLLIYRQSHLFRMFVHVILRKDMLFLSKKERVAQTKLALVEISKSISRINQFAKEQGIDLVVVTHPIPYPKISKSSKNRAATNQKICNEDQLKLLAPVSSPKNSTV